MEKLEKLSGQSMDIVADNIAKLKELFSEILTENKIDFNTLKALLGEEVDETEERYSFTWHGKTQARRLAQTPSTGTLRPCKEDSVDWDTTQNLFIEGDNLEVLKLLQKSHHKQVKMIYIDPPYNTGSDFVYPDNFQDNIQNYLELTGQVESGRKIGTNTESSGRYHTDWLNMLYPRLKLARNLLNDKGLIFISIDDDEQANLRKICDEIFGEENFIGKLIHKNNSSKNQAKQISVSTEYIFCFAKNKNLLKDEEWRLLKKGASDISKLYEDLKKQGLTLDGILDEVKEMYKRPKYSHLSRWNKVDEIGVFMDADLSREGGPKDYTITNPITGIDCIVPERGWGKQHNELLAYQDQNLIWYGDPDTPPRLKSYISTDSESVPDNFFYYDNSVDTREIKTDFGDLVFQNPKPKEMIKHLVSMIKLNENDVVMDFFAGSGTTGIALMEQNIIESKKLRYLLVQLPEKLDPENKEQKAAVKYCELKNKPLILTEVTKDRLKIAINKLRAQNPSYQGDFGFKVFKLDSSNLKPWDADFDSLATDLAESANILKTGRSNEDVLFEILLKYGLDLTLPIETHQLAGKTVYEVGAGALIVCLDDGVTEAVAEAIGKLKETLAPEVMRVVFKDSSFANDAAKVNAVQVLKQYGIDDVKAI